jgi:malate dehydrogenase (oxaloacetate-decarboxylating)(NADP+)
LNGLLPPAIEDIEQQVKRVLTHLALKPDDLERYIYLGNCLTEMKHFFTNC